MDTEKRVLTPYDVAEICHISYRSVLKLLRTGKLAHARAGDKYLISDKSLEKYLSGESNKVGSC